MKTKLKLTVVTLLAVVAVLGATNSALASEHNGDTRPGWGHGDKNHTHTGPPGQSVSVNPGDDHHWNGGEWKKDIEIRLHDVNQRLSRLSEMLSKIRNILNQYS